MLKTKLATSVLCLSLAFGINCMQSSSAYAAEQIINGMSIDVNYDPFNDCIKSTETEEVKPADTTKLTFSQKMASKEKEANAKSPANVITTTGVIPGNIYIPKRTALNVELLDKADCKKLKKYQNIEFKTTENLIINDVVVIPSGTVGKGYVYDVQKPGGFGRKGVLRIAASEIKTINGIKVPLMKGLEGKGKTDGGAVAVAAAVSLVGGIFMKGSGVSYEAGTDFVVEVRNDTDLQCTADTLAKTMDMSKPRGNVIYIK